MAVTQSSPPAEKIALFRSLFRGREEVHARRFENARTGRSGYAPACGNEWVRGVCEKPRVKCGDCPHQSWLPLSDEVLRWHLSGEDGRGRPFVGGVYPMLLDERCCFLAVDFDEGDWSDDALAYGETCRRFGIPVALERSRSGAGGHVWIFFEEAVPAILARKLEAFLLTETMESRPEAGLESYDRFFPAPDAEGAARARSASEAFIFQRLETLPELAGKFRLNALLPIPFDDRGRMEVDLLCKSAGLVIEIDGAQHLGNPEAYRRDRRKDALLQSHGWLVLRFLADDLGKRLDEVLDAVLRAVVGQIRGE